MHQKESKKSLHNDLKPTNGPKEPKDLHKTES